MDVNSRQISNNNKDQPDQKQLAYSFVDVVKSSWFIAIIAIVCALGLIFLFGLLTDAVFDKALVNPDQGFAKWTYSLASPALTTFLTLITDIGSPLGTGILTAITFGLLVWRKHYSLAWLLVILVGGSAILDETLKLIFQRTRPTLLIGGQHLSSYSFPSGHATGSICFYGFLIWLSLNFIKVPLLKWLAVAGSVLMILLVGFSRIYLGVHYPTDVLGGYLSGGSWLIIFLTGYSIYKKSRIKAKQ
jgi:undecaprenyl-diphosphatase